MIARFGSSNQMSAYGRIEIPIKKLIEFMNDKKNSSIEAWKKSRSGAWSGRGFHFQHLFSVLILVRQWAGLAPAGNLVPEGLEDCVIELPGEEYWLQVKSRKQGKFSDTEVTKILYEVRSKANSVQKAGERKIFCVLEQPCSEIDSIAIEKLFDENKSEVLVCNAPQDEAIKILKNQLIVAEIIVEGILSDLYKLVASCSEENASLSFENRRRISTSEIERRIFEQLEAQDPSAIDHALYSGLLAPVDFTRPKVEPTFYQGVKVSPGHVASGLVLDRDQDKDNVIRSLQEKRNVLISGPSGAGKSALLWLTTESLIGGIRWFQVTSSSIASDADSIIRFLRARRPSEKSPIGLVLDEIGSTNADLWDVLVRELRSLPSIYLLGTVRREDIPLISNLADIEVIEINLNEPLAESMWLKLKNDGQTEWEHWREPFEQSEGLMLEYVHILTQGKRLASVIQGQVLARQQENRDEELAILRIAAMISSESGDIETSKLINLLDIKPEAASRALARLIDEHLIRESQPGVLGGLHMLRSRALAEASHDQIVFLTEESLWQGLPAVTNETLPRVVQSVLSSATSGNEESTLARLSNLLTSSDDIEAWIAILTGLGLATLERNVVSFMNILEKHGVQRAQWSLASMLSDPKVNLPDLGNFVEWQKIREAVLEFHTLPRRDLRQLCLGAISDQHSSPSCKSLYELNKLFACLSPICGGAPIDIDISTNISGNGDVDIYDVRDVLSSAYLISPEMAANLVENMGGEKTLFRWFTAQMPWVTSPEVDPRGKHGRTVRSDIFAISDNLQKDLHKSVCDICETLIAISPASDAAASDAITPSGRQVTIGDYQPYSKNMPRENIPAKARVSWNVAFRQILLARSASDSLTTYTNTMADLVKQTEKVFRTFSEKWIKGKKIPNVDALADEINSIIQAVNEISYAAPERPSHDMTQPASNAGEDDSLGALLTGILGNLMRRMNQVSGEGNPKSTATFAGSLANQARDHEKSHIWRTSLNPPTKELLSLAERLIQVSNILHEFGYDNSDAFIQKVIKFTKNSAPSRALHAASRRCAFLAQQRFDKSLRSIEKDLREKGWSSKCWSRPIDGADSPFWPPREIAISVDINDFETDAEYINAACEIADRHFNGTWLYRVVPVINGFIVAPFAMLQSSSLPLPDQDFSKNWEEHIALPFISSPILEKLDEALSACIQVSAIINCRNLDSLHPEEDRALSDAIEVASQSHEYLSKAAEQTGTEEILWAADYVSEYWSNVVNEFKAAKEGITVENPICNSPHQALGGQPDDRAVEMASVRILILQAECFREAD